MPVLMTTLVQQQIQHQVKNTTNNGLKQRFRTVHVVEWKTFVPKNKNSI